MALECLMLSTLILLLGFLVYYLESLNHIDILLFNNRIKQYHSNLDKSSVINGRESYDYIVIGSGSSGSVVASRLTETSDTVLLLEAGGADSDHRIQKPSSFPLLYGSEYDWGYNSEPQKNIDGSIISSPRGKVFGGTSSINAMIYMRGSAYDYNEWERLGFKGWGWEYVLPFFKKSENNLSYPEGRFHGKQGPWNISDIPEADIPEIQQIIQQAISEELNIPIKDDLNGEDYQTEGSSNSQFNQYRARRVSVSDSFLDNEVLQRNNLYIKLNTRAKKILFDSDNKTAIGVEVFDSITNLTRTIAANKEVILCAGAFNSPQILLLSGIGNRTELEKLNIKVIQDNPEVGKNLKDHLATYISWEGKNISDSIHALQFDWSTYFHSLWQFYFSNDPNKTGLFGFHGSYANAIFKSEIAKSKGESAPDIQIIGKTYIPSHNKNQKEVNKENFPNGGFGVLISLLAPKSKGSVKLRSADFIDPPLIDFNTFDVREDEERIVSGWKRANLISNNSEFVKKTVRKIYFDEGEYEDRELKKKLMSTYYYLFHSSSTLAMGKVVDERLKVKGIERLRVVDASVMPDLVRANTNAACVMIGEKGADMIIKDKNSRR